MTLFVRGFLSIFRLIPAPRALLGCVLLSFWAIPFVSGQSYSGGFTSNFGPTLKANLTVIGVNTTNLGDLRILISTDMNFQGYIELSGTVTYEDKSTAEMIVSYGAGLQQMTFASSSGGSPAKAVTLVPTPTWVSLGLSGSVEATLLPPTIDTGDFSISRILHWWDFVADPVSPTSGDFCQNQTDLHISGPLPIEVRRTYSSRNSADNEFGIGWLTAYPAFLIPSDSTAYPATIKAADGDGSVITFRQQAGSTTIWTPTVTDNPELSNVSGGANNLVNSTIVRTVASDNTITYQWNRPDGSARNYVVRQFPIAIFNRERPYLSTWTDNRGNKLSFAFGENPTNNDYGLINQITSSNGSSVSFTYNSTGHITQATAADGRVVNYGYTNGDLTSVQLPDGSTTAYQYGASNHLITQETKPDGRILQNVYDSSNRVIQQKATVDVTQPTVPVVNATFDYSVANQTTVTDAYGHSTVYHYTTGGLITSIVDPLGHTTTKTWYSATDTATGAYGNSLESETDPRGLVTHYKYDSQGNVIETKLTGDLDGDPGTTTETATTTATYTSLNLPQTVTDASGITTTFTYGDSNYPYLPTQIVTAKGTSPLRTDQLEYTACSDGGTTFSKGLLLRKTVALGTSDQAATEYAYNSTGFLLSETRHTGTADPAVVTAYSPTARNEILAVTDGDGRSTTYTYDEMSRPLTRTVKDEAGTVIGVSTTSYTANGEPAVTTGMRTGPSDTVTRTYDAMGRLNQETATRSEAKTDGSGVQASTSATTVYTHDLFGNLAAVIDPRGNTTLFTYDPVGQLQTKKAYPGSATTSTAPASFVASGGPIVWHLSGYTLSLDNPTAVQSTVSPGNWTLTFPVSEDLHAGWQNYSYTKTTAAGTTSGTFQVNYPATSFSMEVGSDVTSLVVASTSGGVGTITVIPAFNPPPSPLRSEGYTYEPGGKVQTYTNPLGGVTTTYYTFAGKPRRQENPDGSVQEWRYYTDGRLQKEILRNGSYWLTTYDDIAHTVTRTLTKADGSTVLATVVSTFDLRGNLISQTDPEGYAKTFTYDGLNRLKTATGPAAVTGSAQQTTTNIYSASAKTATTQNALGEQTVTVSDALGRPLTVDVKNSSGTVVRRTGYAYSADHQAVTVTNGTGSGAISRTTYTDLSGKPVLDVDGLGKFTRMTYDLNGNRLTTTDPLNHTTTWTYNELNQVATQVLPDTNLTTFTHDVAGHLTLRSMAGGLNAEQLYDSAGRIISSRLYNGSTVSRSFAYAYYPSTSPWAGLLQTTTAPRDTVTTTYDDYLRPYTVTTDGAAAETDSTTTYGYDKRGLVTSVAQSSPGDAAGPATLVSRGYDGYGQLLTETITVGGDVHSSITQVWNSAGRRNSLNEAGSTLAAPLFAYQYRADGRLTQATANGQDYAFGFADNGLATTRTNPFRTLTVNTRDAAGRIQQATTTVNSVTAMVETQTWRDDGTLDTYGVTRSGTGAWDESRGYGYNDRGQVTSEGFSPAPTTTATLAYAFDNNTAGLGVRTDAKVGSGAPSAWQSSATTVNPLSRVTEDQTNAFARSVPANGASLGADHVDLLLDGVSQGRATHPGWADSVGAWSKTLTMGAGSHVLTANAVHPSGHFTATTSSTFTVNVPLVALTTGYDDDGNVSSRTCSNGTAQTLTWDAFNRLIKVSQRDGSNNGYDWTAICDGIGRRLKTTQQAVTADAASGSPLVTISIFDPQVEFLEIGVAVNGVKAWKVYGNDLNGRFGGLQGTGGLEATILDAGGTTNGVVNDQFGNGVASVTGATLTWFSSKVGAYGPLPNSTSETLTDITRVAEATAWRSRRVDPTGFYNLGARYYEPTSGRFLSPDPLGHAASMSLYDFANGDPVNQFDPDGRLFVGAAIGAVSGGIAGYYGALAQGGTLKQAALGALAGATVGGLIGAADPTEGLVSANEIVLAAGAIGAVAGGAGDIVGQVVTQKAEGTPLNKALSNIDWYSVEVNTAGGAIGGMSAGLGRVFLADAIEAAGGGEVTSGVVQSVLAFPGSTLLPVALNDTKAFTDAVNDLMLKGASSQSIQQGLDGQTLIQQDTSDIQGTGVIMIKDPTGKYYKTAYL